MPANPPEDGPAGGPNAPAGRTLEADLRDVRETKGISLASIQQETRIPADVLVRFESGRLLGDPAFNEVYLRAFLRAYASAVGLQASDVVAGYDAQRAGAYRGLNTAPISQLSLGLGAPSPGVSAPPPSPPPAPAEDAPPVAPLEAPPAAPPDETPAASALSPVVEPEHTPAVTPQAPAAPPQAQPQAPPAPAPIAPVQPTAPSAAPFRPVVITPRATQPTPPSQPTSQPVARPVGSAAPAVAALAAAPTPGPSPAPAPVESRRRVKRADAARTPRAFDRSWGLLIGGTLVAVAVVGGLLWWLFRDSRPAPAEPPPVVAADTTRADTARAAEPAPVPVSPRLALPIRVTVTALNNGLQSFRVTQAPGGRSPYWIDSGASQTFESAEEVVLWGEGSGATFEDATLELQGIRWTPQGSGPLRINAATGQRLLDSLAGSAPTPPATPAPPAPVP